MLEKIMIYTFIATVFILGISILYGIYTFLETTNTPTWAIVAIECLCIMIIIGPVICH